MKRENCNFSFSNKGYAVITTTILTLAVSLVIVSGFAFFSFQEVNVTRAFEKSIETRYVSEAGIEDGVYRVLANKQIASGDVLTIGNDTATMLVTNVGNDRIIRSDGAGGDYSQSLETRVQVSSDAVSFFYGVQVGDGGLTMNNNSTVNGNIYSNGSIIGSSGATITGDATVAGGIADTPSVEWPTQNADQAFATASSNRDIAQSFTATASGPVTRVTAYLAKVGSPASNLTVRLTSDNGGKPATSALASVAIPAISVGTTPSWISVAFSSPPNVTNGTKYWIVLDYGANSGTNYWNWRKDTSDGYAGNTGRYTSDWSSGAASWTNVGGDLAFQVWIGGVVTKIDSVTIGNGTSGTGRANLFVNTTVHGSACPNAYCIVENPPRQEMPIPDGVIQDWRDQATAGGTCVQPQCDTNGNLTLSNGASASIGPKKITGNLNLSNNAYLTLTGTVWVQGTIQLSNNCSVSLDPGYGSLSGTLLTDSTASISNGCVFSGSGSQGSYFMLLSAKNAPTQTVISVSNNAVGVIYYAPNGKIDFSNGAAAKEATAYGIELENNASITYESGLANLQFSSGPSGGYEVKYWKKVE